MKREPHACIRTDTHRVQVAAHCCDGTCRDGRDCPQIVNRVSPLAGTPKEKQMDNYRRDSGAWTGYAPRSLEQRWPTPPRAIEPGWFVRLIRFILGR